MSFYADMCHWPWPQEKPRHLPFSSSEATWHLRNPATCWHSSPQHPRSSWKFPGLVANYANLIPSIFINFDVQPKQKEKKKLESWPAIKKNPVPTSLTHEKLSKDSEAQRKQLNTQSFTAPMAPPPLLAGNSCARQGCDHNACLPTLGLSGDTYCSEFAWNLCGTQ